MLTERDIAAGDKLSTIWFLLYRRRVSRDGISKTLQSLIYMDKQPHRREDEMYKILVLCVPLKLPRGRKLCWAAS